MTGVLPALLCAVCYSLSYVLLHRGQAELESEDNGLLPVLVVGALTLGFAAVIRAVHSPTPPFPATSWAGYGLCAVGGIIGTMLGRMSLYGAIRLLGPTRGVVIGTLETMVTLALATLFLQETLNGDRLAGVILIFASIGVLLWERIHQAQRSFLTLGMTLGMAAALFKGTGHFLRKWGMNQGLDPVVAAAIDLVAACLSYLAVLAASGRLGAYVRVYTRSFNVYLWSAGCLSAAGVLLFFVAAASSPISTVAVIVGLEPVIVAVLSAVVLRGFDRLTAWTAVYALLATLGVMLAH
ncbi:EamA family transporter [Alicyclobacillus sp.]|uniref:EamA family transporter n=1 Tax=Alicyclobacillus sp. TaxID=61169 RepID=UPI0025B82846|nr:EamA family transporter [Alicyclobacillus sp.]MCL6517680.1 DMT family transporter [Alicyclobacillus sp.]